MEEKQTRRRFSKEFKIDAVELALRSDKSIVEIAEELGIRPELLYRWKIIGQWFVIVSGGLYADNHLLQLLLQTHGFCFGEQEFKTLSAVGKGELLAQRFSCGSAEECMMLFLGNVDSHDQMPFRTPDTGAQSPVCRQSFSFRLHDILLSDMVSNDVSPS